MLIVALVLAVIGLAALVTAVVTSNELVAWVCIAASVLGVILLIVDAIRERQNRVDGGEPAAAAAADDSAESFATAETTAYAETGEALDSTYATFDADYPDDEATAEDQPDEVSDAADEPEEPAADGESETESATEPKSETETEDEPSGESGSR
ncbi:hypothetical protein ORI20_24080 [Mycobacterium sp. CVI_P3]|uniref:Transmembrane protein n=1 Tax=Mycobacterium pinniadriaticum TaxID=2994102 RepID=A0ABT3SKT2_9MYCO|nr:hypothetical protein [Mycobacterium pinniadriaticum]MCX2933356.1 hypothetical protein [Mycobacterium pinniadriaticum]MCX2939778.1 hypothetical protein [Mycobacterium pinniadriaticum]